MCQIRDVEGRYGRRRRLQRSRIPRLFSVHGRNILLRKARIRYSARTPNQSVRMREELDVLPVAPAHVRFDIAKLSQSVSWFWADAEATSAWRKIWSLGFS
jgi:hypothetical protein